MCIACKHLCLRTHQNVFSRYTQVSMNTPPISEIKALRETDLSLLVSHKVCPVYG